MNIFLNSLIYSLLNLSPVFVEIFCLLIKLFILISLFFTLESAKRNKTFLYLAIILATGIFTNISLIFVRLGCPPYEYFPPHIFRAIARLEAATLLLQFYFLLNFFYNLSSKKIYNYVTKFFFVLSLVTSFCLIGFFLGWGIYTYIYKDVEIYNFFHRIIYFNQIFYLIEGLIALSLIYVNYKSEKIKILKHHIFSLGMYFMLPYWIVKIFESDFVAPTLNFSSTSIIVNLPASSITSILLTAMIYYCSKKLLGLRFLDIKKHVESKPSEKYNFIDDFKSVLGKLSTITSVEFVGPVTKNFFHDAFDIPAENVNTFLKDCRFCDEGVIGKCEDDARKLFIEKALGEESSKIVSCMHSNKIMIFDELELTNFYNQQSNSDEDLRTVIEFLENLNVDIFLPIYSDGKLVSYILVNRNSRENKFYTDVERDEMLIYADYLGRVIYLLTNMNLNMLLLRERELKAELYKKDKNIELLKRSISMFLDIGNTRKIGVLTYKNKKFAYCNQVAKQLLKIDLNKDRGLEITQTISQMGHDSAVFLTSKKELISTTTGDKLLVVSTPNLMKNNTVITVSNPSISDVIQDDITLLKEQNKWDYLLGLKTTFEGELLNQLIPSNALTFLNFKINFFEYALTKKTILLELASEDDILSFAHIAHKISNRTVFEEVSLRRSASDEALGLKLFGINQILKTTQEDGLFETLHLNGTLLLNNIHFLSMSMQKKILDFLISGKFSPLKSDESIESDILLICSTNQNLEDLVNRGLFLKDLYVELQKSTIFLPSLSMLAEDEFLSLAEGFRLQIIQSKVYQKMFSFTEQEKNKLISSGCVSIYELKNKIQNLLLKRTRKQALDDEAIIDPAYNIADLDLVEAARLGKHALKDPKLISLLMQKFKNNQAKVASFLGVNRSTVSRRCAQFGIDSLIERSKFEDTEISED